MKRKNKILIISTVILVFTFTFTCLFATPSVSAPDGKEDYEQGLREELGKIFNDPEEIEQFIENTEHFKPIIRKTEFSEGSSTKGADKLQPDMIIITNDELKPKFLEFAAIKNREGIWTQVVTTSQIGDTPEEIRQYLKTKKQNNPSLKYVLIGGDASVIMPRIIYINNKTDYSSFPTDYYFCNVLSDWVSDDEVNFEADLYVGRIPADTGEEVQNFINKYIAYRYNGNYSEKYRLIANNLGRVPGHTGGNMIIDLIALHIDTDIDFTYEEDLDGSYSTPPIPAGVLLGNAFNTDNHSFVFNVTHGGDKTITALNINSNWYMVGGLADYPNSQEITNVYEWSNGSNGYFYEYLPDYLTNTNPYVLWNSSCGSTKLVNVNNEPQDCIGACFLTDNNGGVAYYGSSHYDQPFVIHYSVDNFMDIIFDNEIYRIGDIFTQSHEHIYEDASWSLLRNLALAQTLFGDPSMQIWSKRARKFNVYRLKSEHEELERFLVLDAIEREKPVSNVRCNLISEGDNIFLRGFTDGEGVVEFNVGDEDISEMELTAIKANFIPYSERVDCIKYYGKGDEGQASESDISLSCYPNPIWCSTTISFSLHREGAENAKIKIYNIKGQLVKNFGDLTGKEEIIWNGEDEKGNQLSNGIYFYRLEAKSYKSDLKKMVLLR
jgi:hypothetical protein